MTVVRRLCSVEGCSRVSRANSFCNGHYKRMRRYGDPLGGGTVRGDPMKWLLDVAMAFEGDDCLEFPYAKLNCGYGAINDNGSVRTTSNFICEKAHGPAPEDGRYEAAHSCGNRPCCNKRHIRWATPLENTNDKRHHGRIPFGALMSRFSDDDCLDMIRMRRRGDVLSRISAKYDTDPRTVSRIVNGQSRHYLQELAGFSPQAS